MFPTLLHHISQYKAKGDCCGRSRNRKRTDYSGIKLCGRSRILELFAIIIFSYNFYVLILMNIIIDGMFNQNFTPKILFYHNNRSFLSVINYLFPRNLISVKNSNARFRNRNNLDGESEGLHESMSQCKYRLNSKCACMFLFTISPYPHIIT